MLSRDFRGAVALAEGVSILRASVDAQLALEGVRLVVTYFVAHDSHAGIGELLLDYSQCPLAILGADAAGSQLRDVSSRMGRPVLAASSHGDSDAHGKAFRVVLDWPTDRAVQGRLVPIFVAPEWLPEPLLADRISRARWPLFASASSEVAEYAGVQIEAGAWDPQRRQQRQLVVVPRAIVAHATPNVVIAGPEAVGSRPENLRACAAEITSARDFLSEELGHDVSVRFLLFSDNRANRIAKVAGAAIVGDAAMTGTQSGDLRPLSVLGTDDVAAVWWGVAIRMPGVLGAAVEAGIRYALALRRHHVLGQVTHLEILKDWIESRMRSVVASGDGPSREGVRLVTRLSFELFEAMTARDTVRKEMRSMTAEYWGDGVQPTVVLDRLQTVGVRVPPTHPALLET